MNSFTVRLADNQDREALCRLYAEFHEFHVHGVPDRLVSQGDPADARPDAKLLSTLAQIIDGDDSAIFVAEVGGRVVGLAEVYLRQDEPSSHRLSYRYGYLQSLVVCQELRRRGLGAQLVSAAEQWAKAKGAAEMRVKTWEFSEGPLEFYERAGYRTLRRMLVRGL